MNAKQYQCTVVSNTKINSCYCHLVLKAPAIVKDAAPGQFVHLRINDSLKPFFRRPFSIFRVKKGLEILYEVVGDGTRELALKKKGDRLDVLGPLGTSFSIPPQKTRQVVMIAGGVGVAPMAALSDALGKKYNQTLLFGVRNKKQLFDLKSFKQNGCKVCVSSDDGSVGKKGRVSVLFPQIARGAEKVFIYACGPRPMIASVAEFARKNDIQGEVSLEEVMACGVGVCLGCSVKLASGYKTVCHDGPVFNVKEIV